MWGNAFYGFAIGSLLVAIYSGEHFKVPLRVYHTIIASLIAAGTVLNWLLRGL